MNALLSFRKLATALVVFLGLLCLGYTNELEQAIRSFPDITAGNYRPDLAVNSANTLISAGSVGACAALDSVAKERSMTSTTISERGAVDRKVCHLCRLLFASQVPTQPLRPPRLGSLKGLPYYSMGASAWPDLPFVIVNDIPLSLSSGYIIAGLPESGENYLAYCRANGVFRTRLYAQPTSLSASNALCHVFASADWKNLKWKDRGDGWSYDLDRSDTEQILWTQVTNASER